ncbi:hypothetical protein RND81_11G197300 [Saponaria officinalis]|uniref:Retrovirus-related Pol polyprotein from transposon TNT 1-94-like beta-barrel domain-containing protein n=1 Tax=Saponaria officinalis TaxID=3572 RepID=A0AAW1HPC9_SAPOF
MSTSTSNSSPVSSPLPNYDTYDDLSAITQNNTPLVIQSKSVFSASYLHSLTDWIVDTGASKHMTSQLNILHDITTLHKPIMVGLPDGTVKLVRRIGKMALTPLITLHKVLIVPDFRQNLLSVGRFIDDNHLQVVFTSTDCVLQDLSSKVSIGVAHRNGDLYWFRPTHSSFVCSTVDTPTCVFASNNVSDKSVSLHLFHSRMGHCSIDRIRHFHDTPVHNVNDFFL